MLWREFKYKTGGALKKQDLLQVSPGAGEEQEEGREGAGAPGKVSIKRQAWVLFPLHLQSRVPVSTAS